MARSASKLRSTRSGIVKFDFLLCRIATICTAGVCSFPSVCGDGSNTTTGIVRPATAGPALEQPRRKKHRNSRCPDVAAQPCKAFRRVVPDFFVRAAPRCAPPGFQSHRASPDSQRLVLKVFEYQRSPEISLTAKMRVSKLV